MIQQKVWVTLVNLKFKGFLVHLLVQKYQKLDRNINLFLAIASSSSVGAWAVWKTLPLVWASIIVASQVITVAKPYFPYYKYVKELNSKCLQIESLNLEFERLFNLIQRKKLLEDAGWEMYYDFKKQMNEILSFSDDTIIDAKQSVVQEANQKMKIFLESEYGITISINS